MKGLTKKQREVFSYILEYIQRNNYSPSFREIQSFFGFSSLGSVSKYINILSRKGFLTYEEKCGRSIMPTSWEKQDYLKSEIEVPFIGHISAVSNIETFPQAQMLNVSGCLIRSPNITYVLRARGSSLSDEMIADGDLLIVEARSEAYPLESIVGFVHGEKLVVRKYNPEGNYVRMSSISSNVKPIIVRSDDLTIHGVLVGLLRVYS